MLDWKIENIFRTRMQKIAIFGVCFILDKFGITPLLDDNICCDSCRVSISQLLYVVVE